MFMKAMFYSCDIRIRDNTGWADSLVLWQAEAPGLRVAWLGKGRHRPNFNEPKAQRKQGFHHFRVLIEAGCNAKGVGEAAAPHLNSERWRVGAGFAREQTHPGRPQSKVVGCFSVEQA